MDLSLNFKLYPSNVTWSDKKVSRTTDEKKKLKLKV